MDDLISRKDLMKKIAHHTVHDSMSYVTFERSTVYEMVKGDMFGLVKDAPAVASMPRWISVEERLLEKHRVVLVHLRFGMIDTGVHNGFTWWNDLGIANNKNVTHWMPLPPAPKEDSAC